MVRRILTALVVLIGAGIATAGAQAGAPRYIMVSGHGIAAPILLANWRENGKLETALSYAPEAAPSKSLARRPRLRLSLFWGWDEHRPARPGEANQYGWLYPASGTQPALVALMLDGRSSLRIATAPLLHILERHAVPIGRHVRSP
jgi:hypothetical protein